MRTRLLDAMLLIPALLGPVLHLVGIMTRGLALYYVDYRRLGLIYVALALSAASAAFLTFRRTQLAVRLVAGAALLVNIGSIAYTGKLWSNDMQRALAEVQLAPVNEGQVGLLVCPASQEAEAVADARALEALLAEMVEKAGLTGYITIRHAYPVESVEQARRLGEEMRAHVVVWEEWAASPRSPDLIETRHHVTVLGTNNTPMTLDASTLMVLMATQDTLSVPEARPRDQENLLPLVRGVVAPTAAGFGFLTAGQTMLGAAQFSGALSATDVPSDTLRSLHNHYGTALLMLNRPDLAMAEFQASNAIQGNAAAWTGIGNAALALRDRALAQRAYDNGIAADPYNPMPYCGRGYLRGQEADVRRAVSACSQAVSLDPDGSIPYALLGISYELAGDAASARQAYQTSALYAGPNGGLHAALLQRAEDVLRNPPTAVPTVTPQPTMTPAPIPTRLIYRVQKGDTLNTIAQDLGVPIERLVEMNKITDPNSLVVGQELFIPDE